MRTGSHVQARFTGQAEKEFTWFALGASLPLLSMDAERAARQIIGAGRPIWKTAPVRLGVTVVTMILLVTAAVIVVVTGGLAQKVGNVLGLGSTAVTVWDIAKWPVLLIIIGLILAILFWASPNVRHGFQWVSPGGFVAVVLWLVASALFAVYIANFSHYNKVYGSLASVIIFLIWIQPGTSLSRNCGTTASCGRKRSSRGAEPAWALSLALLRQEIALVRAAMRLTRSIHLRRSVRKRRSTQDRTDGSPTLLAAQRRDRA